MIFPELTTNDLNLLLTNGLFRAALHILKMTQHNLKNIHKPQLSTETSVQVLSGESDENNGVNSFESNN